ncbi:MAG: NlpC/P60 family protein [Desulfitobacteriaceae bacterium]|nr:NlpC/P60 family protein [Desulfitobacteriaceae bacterium]
MRKNWRISTLTVLIILFTCSTVVMASPANYVVKKGDCLWAIANSNGTSVSSIKQLNGLSSDLIYIGQTLRLSNSETTQATTSNPVANNTSSQYVIQPGDSLWSIAQKFGTTVDYLKIINGLTDNTVYAGKTLLVRGTVVNTTVSRSSDNLTGSRVVAKAAQYLGTPYRYGGSSPNGFDCSGFTQYIFRQLQVSINRTAASQYNNGFSVSKANLIPGDLVFFNTSGGISHVGIYAGNGQFIHSSSARGKVIYSALSTGYYAQTFVGARRIIR